MMDDQLKVYTLEEVEVILKVTRRTLYNFIKSGRIKAIKVGREWRISSENLQRFLNGE
jgi:excisionase family DNA binding protein